MQESAKPGRSRRSRRRGRWATRLVPVALVLTGAAVMTGPVFATYHHNVESAAVAAQYVEDVAQVSPVATSRELARARHYNDTLSATSLEDPWTTPRGQETPAHTDYLRQLDTFAVMARLRIPSIRVDLPVLHDTTEESLDLGAGHLYGSSLPVGGRGTHAVLAGHSGMASATLFDHLPELTVGDRFFLDVYGETLTYRVDDLEVVLPGDLDSLTRAPGKDYVTLVTCTPVHVNSHRLLVRGRRVPTPVAAARTTAPARADLSIQPWMYSRLAGGGAGLLLALAMLGGLAGNAFSDRQRPHPVHPPQSAVPPTSPGPVPSLAHAASGEPS